MKARKWLALLLTLTLLLGVIGIGGITTSANVTEDQLAKLTLYGRTYVKNNTLFLYWTNSGFSFNMNGTGATITVNTSSTTPIYLGYLHVYVDGAFEPTATICIAKNGTYTLAENLPAGNHTIEVRKRNEANYGGSATIGVQSLDIIGGQACRADPSHRIRRRLHHLRFRQYGVGRERRLHHRDRGRHDDLRGAGCQSIGCRRTGAVPQRHPFCVQCGRSG